MLSSIFVPRAQHRAGHQANPSASRLCFYQSLTPLARLTESTLGPRASEGAGDKNDPMLLVHSTPNKMSLVKNLGIGLQRL